MKKILIVLATAIVFASCAKKGTLDCIFEDKGQDVISTEQIDGKDAIIANGFDEYQRYHSLIHMQFQDFYKENPDENYYKSKAMIINNQDQLVTVTFDGEVYEWPKIDFSKYSLVIAKCYGGYAGYFANRMRIKEGGENFGLHIEFKGTGYGVQYLTKPGNSYVAALFPKLSFSQEYIPVYCYQK